MELEAAFGQTLREFRREANISQEELALECGLDRTYISLLERGRRQPTLKSLFKISKILKVTPSEFVLAVEKKIKENTPLPPNLGVAVRKN